MFHYPISLQKGTPSECLFSLFSYTCTDSFCLAHLQWLCHYCATIDNFCLASPKHSQKRNNTPQKNDKTQLSATTPFLGVCNLVFSFGFMVSWFLVFWVSWLLVFWLVVVFLKGWQNNTKVKDLDLTLCQLSHFRGCKLPFDWLIACYHVKTKAQCRYHWWKLWGLGTQISQFCMFMYCSKMCLQNIAKP